MPETQDPHRLEANLLFATPRGGAPSRQRRGPHTRGRRNPKVRYPGSCSGTAMNEDDMLVWLPTSFMTAPNPDLTPNTLHCRARRVGSPTCGRRPRGQHDSALIGRGARTPHSPDHTSVRPASPTSRRLTEEGEGGGRPTRFHSHAMPVETPWYILFFDPRGFTAKPCPWSQRTTHAVSQRSRARGDALVHTFFLTHAVSQRSHARGVKGRPTRFHSGAVPVETPWYILFF